MGRFPCITGRIAALRLPMARPRRPPFPRAAVPTSRQETTGPPRFLGIPCVYAPCSLTPAGPPCRAVAPNRASARRCCRAPMERRRLPQRYFGALSHGIYTRCLRFAARVTPGPRKTRFRAVASLLRVDGAKLTSTGTQHEVSLSSWHPPHPGLSWRTPSVSWAGPLEAHGGAGTGDDLRALMVQSSIAACPTRPFALRVSVTPAQPSVCQPQYQ